MSQKSKFTNHIKLPIFWNVWLSLLYAMLQGLRQSPRHNQSNRPQQHENQESSSQETSATIGQGKCTKIFPIVKYHALGSWD